MNLGPYVIALLKYVVFYVILEGLLSKVGMNRFVSVAESDSWENVAIFTHILEHSAWEISVWSWQQPISRVARTEKRAILGVENLVLSEVDTTANNVTD